MTETETGLRDGMAVHAQEPTRSYNTSNADVPRLPPCYGESQGDGQLVFRYLIKRKQIGPTG